jgi:mannose-6-phosphate isomerase-like protein (cupin superfamily)
MIVKRLYDCEEIIAGDNTFLRELIHPKNDKIDPGFSVAFAKVPPGGHSGPHRINSTFEAYHILSGEGRIYVGSENKPVVKGDTILVPPNYVQHIENSSNAYDLEFLCIVSPSWKQENDEPVN